MTRKPITALALCAGLTVAVFAAQGTPAKKSQVTVGEFAVKVASALGYEARDQKGAQERLRSMGVSLAADLNAPLTEGAVARIMADLGVSVLAPAAPETPVSSSRASYLTGTIVTNSFGTEDNPPVPVEPPAICFQQPNRGACVECCKAAVGPLPGDCEEDPNCVRDAGKECGRLCHNNVPPPISDEEPQP